MIEASTIEAPFDLLNIDKSDWKTYRFDQIAFNISERVEPQETDLEIYVGLEHLDPESIHIKRWGKPSDVEGTKLKVYPGDVIFGKRRAYQRKAALATFEGICSAHAMVLRPNSKVIEPDLFLFFLHSDAFMHRAIDISVGSLSPTINWKTLAVQEFQLPPKEQQAKLAVLLWAAELSINKYSDVLDELAKLKKIKLDDLSPRRKEDSSYSEKTIIGFIKKGWRLIRQGDVAKFYNGRAYKLEEWEKQGTPVIRLQNLTGTGDVYYYSNLQLPKHQYCEKGDLLYMWSATFGAHIWNGPRAIYHYHIWKVECDPNVLDKQFMYYNLEEVTRRMMKQTNGSTMLHITKKGMEDLLIALPPYHEQIEIRNLLSKIDDQTKEVDDQINKMKNIKSSIVNKIFK